MIVLYCLNDLIVVFRPGEDDICDEALNYFRANVLFSQFEVKGPSDRTLIYLTLFIHFVFNFISRVDPSYIKTF